MGPMHTRPPSKRDWLVPVGIVGVIAAWHASFALMTHDEAQAAAQTVRADTPEILARYSLGDRFATVTEFRSVSDPNTIYIQVNGSDGAGLYAINASQAEPTDDYGLTAVYNTENHHIMHEFTPRSDGRLTCGYYDSGRVAGALACRVR